MEPFKLSSGVYLFLKKNNEVLLLRRANTRWMSGMYSAVSGFIDGNESINHALAREAKEEIGVSVSEKDIKIFHVQHRKSDDTEFIDFYAFAEKWEGTPINIEVNKCDDLRWFHINDLPSNIVPHLEEIFLHMSNSVYISESGF